MQFNLRIEKFDAMIGEIFAFGLQTYNFELSFFFQIIVFGIYNAKGSEIVVCFSDEFKVRIGEFG